MRTTVNTLRLTRTRAFTVPEMLVALALMAIIMTAAAMGLKAAQTSHSYNNDKVELVARARGTLDRITQDIRLGASYTVIDSHHLHVTLNDGSLHSYSWDGTASGTLQYSETPFGGTETTYVILDNYVTDFTVTDVAPACSIRLALTGTKASTHTTVTAIPSKSLF